MSEDKLGFGGGGSMGFVVVIKTKREVGDKNGGNEGN